MPPESGKSKNSRDSGDRSLVPVSSNKQDVEEGKSIVIGEVVPVKQPPHISLFVLTFMIIIAMKLLPIFRFEFLLVYTIYESFLNLVGY